MKKAVGLVALTMACGGHFGVQVPTVMGATRVINPPQSFSVAVQNSSPGDTILVSPGIYENEGAAEVNHPLTIIGIGGAGMNEIRVSAVIGFTLLTFRGTGGVIVDGLTITQMASGEPELSTGIYITNASVVVRNCVFHDLHHRGIIISSIAPMARIEGNLFYGNQTRSLLMLGGGEGNEIMNNTFAANGFANGIELENDAAPVIANNIFAYVVCIGNETSPTFRCNDAWASGGGGVYSGCANATGIDGNISADPLFCDPGSRDYHLLPGSPCLPENSPPGCGLIGAFGACAALAMDDRSSGVRAAMTVVANPALSGVEFTLNGIEESPMLEIFDSQGRLQDVLHVRGERARWTPTGLVPRGVYFARLAGPQRYGVVKFVLIR